MLLPKLKRGPHFPAEPIAPSYLGEVAKRWRFLDGSGEFGLITSVTQPFCGDCSRIRISAEGKSYHCLFTNKSRDVRQVLRNGANDQELAQFLADGWSKRDDRYSELRGKVTLEKAEMSYLGG